MASNQSFVGFEEGRSITCPPLFKGDSYFQWCHQMEFFIKALDFDLWEIIEEGFVEGLKKKKKNMSSKDMGKVKLNAKAMHTLLCGLNDDVSKNVSSCKSSKEMWEKLEKLYKKEEMKCAKVDDKSAHEEPEEARTGTHFLLPKPKIPEKFLSSDTALSTETSLAVPVLQPSYRYELQTVLVLQPPYRYELQTVPVLQPTYLYT
ncbi:hypothetical protein V6N11_072411 [Hibiscus sabdariffa]|uniref:DUF4219 domain-containing protein n=1 Tax=Hibiscus sabdariffa TaxID=183260 RepID=A0ABR2U3J2_9ROSI